MIKMIKELFGFCSKENLTEKIANGTVIIDVRTPQEFAMGHVKGSVNIPLDLLPQKMNKLPKDKPIITCCASGMRSATAKNILLQNGFPMCTMAAVGCLYQENCKCF